MGEFLKVIGIERFGRIMGLENLEWGEFLESISLRCYMIFMNEFFLNFEFYWMSNII